MSQTDGADASRGVTRTVLQAVRRLVPAALEEPLRGVLRIARRQGLRWGSFRRLTPFSRRAGYDRGTPIDRYYIEAFLRRHAEDVGGIVLEVGDPGYTRRFGGDRVRRSEVLHVVEGMPEATLVGDLATGRGIPRSTFDCLILTQTLETIYDVRGAIGTCRDALRPGGRVLATFPGIAYVSRYDMDRWGDCWRFTSPVARQLFAEQFGAENVTVETYGNVLASVAFLHGLATEELRPEELDFHDRDYELLLAVRAVRPA